eukprot:851889-Amphidinium_carterae.2
MASKFCWWQSPCIRAPSDLHGHKLSLGRQMGSVQFRAFKNAVAVGSEYAQLYIGSSIRAVDLG